MFTTSCGWLKYHPFSKYRLPTPYHCEDTGHARDGETLEVPFVDNRTGKERFKKKLWFLRWPGQVSEERARKAQVPAAVVERWPDFKGKDGEGNSHHTVASILENDWLPKENIPELLAYHIAVNYKELGFSKVPYPICGLPAARVQELLDARFTLDRSAPAALTYLKFVAEGHRGHPLLEGFDTNIRETLYGINHEAVRLYFYLLSDYLYDFEAKWWARDGKHLWRPMAIYLHWVGRTGAGLYDSFSGFRGSDWMTRMAQEGLEEAPDLQEQLEKWDLWEHRLYNHDGSHDEILAPSGDEACKGPDLP